MADTGEGTYWVRQTSDVSIDGCIDATIQALFALSKWFYEKTGKRLILTAGTNGSSHIGGGEHSHYTGWKLDVNDYGDGMNCDVFTCFDDNQSWNTASSIAQEFVQYGWSIGLGMNYEDDHFDVCVDGTQWTVPGDYPKNYGGYNGAGGGASIKITETNLTFKNLSDRPATTNIIVHHSGMDEDQDLSAADIHNMHQGKGWSGIGYHYVIRKDGTIEQGRPEDKKGAHCEDAEMNSYSVGIHLSGTFNGSVQPTQAQVDSLVNLLALMCKKYSLSVDRDVIKGHREYSNTNCPGDNLYKALDEIVTRARDVDPTTLSTNTMANDLSKRTPHSGDTGIRVERVGKDTVRLTKLPEKKVFAEPIYPDYVTVSDTVPQWVLDQAMQAQRTSTALSTGKSIPDGDSKDEAPNGMHYFENDIKFLMNEPNNMTREQAIELLSKEKKYTQKVERNEDGTFNVV